MRSLCAISLAILFLTCAPLAAKEKVVAVVSKVSGNAFYMNAGKTAIIKVGTHIPNQAEVFTEVGASLSLNDYYDHLYHLSGSAHVVIHRNLLELKSGYLWTQTKQYDEVFGPLRIVTPNAEVSYHQGEGIISFDNSVGKTQLLAVKGNFVLKNSLEQFMVTDVEEGKFSFVDGSYKKGKPRVPTAVGYDSFKKMTKLFVGVTPLSQQSHPFVRERQVPKKRAQRTVASLKAPSNFEKALMKGHVEHQGHASSTMAATPNQGKVHFVSQRERRLKKQAQSERLKLLKAYQEKIAAANKKKVVKKWRPSYKKSSNVTVRIFGTRPSQARAGAVKVLTNTVPSVVEKKRRTRKPASIAPASAQATRQVTKAKSSHFEHKLLEEYGRQMRHEKELNSLIDELKSVDADYKKNY